MTAFGKIINGRSGVRCDGCGRISKALDGAYREQGEARTRYITSQGRNCEHDFCESCESKLNPDGSCCKCGVR